MPSKYNKDQINVLDRGQEISMSMLNEVADYARLFVQLANTTEPFVEGAEDLYMNLDNMVGTLTSMRDRAKKLRDLHQRWESARATLATIESEMHAHSDRMKVFVMEEIGCEHEDLDPALPAAS